MADIFEPISVSDSFQTRDFNFAVNNDLPAIIPIDPAKIDVNYLQPKLNSAVKSESFSLQDSLNSLNPLQGYEYTDEQQQRYSGQYRPYSVLGSDIEDTYAQNQSAFSKLGNGLGKMATTMGGTFVSSFLSIPQMIDHVLGNEVGGYQEGSAFKAVQDWTQSFEDILPNYYSQQERNNIDEGKWYNNVFTSNFWGDKVIKNLGFTAGAIGATLVQDAILSFVPGVGLGAAVANSAVNLAKMKNAWSGINSVAQEAKLMEAVVNGSRTAESMFSAAQVLAATNNVKNAAQFALRTYLSAQGEAAIEGYHVYDKVKHDLYTQALEEGWDDAKIQSIEKQASDAGSTVALLNLPILAVSNVIQFGKLLSGKGRMSGGDFVSYNVVDNAVKAANSATTKEILKTVGKDAVTSIFTEGSEEAAQGFIGKSVEDFYKLKYDTDSRQTLWEFLKEDNHYKKYLDSQLMEEAFIGGLTGFLTGGIGGLKYRNAKEETQKQVDAINLSLDRFDTVVRELSMGKQSSRQDLRDIYNAVLTQKKFGNFENFKSSFEQLKNLSVENYNEGFGTKFATKADKDRLIDSYLNNFSDIARNIDIVQNAYENPYEKGLSGWVSSRFGDKNDWEKKRLNEYLFNQWKDTVAFNLTQLKYLENKQDVLTEGLKSYGATAESVELIRSYFTGNTQALTSYENYKKTQLAALYEELKYQKDLEKENSSSISTSNLEERITQLKDLLEILDDNKKQTKAYSKVSEVPDSERERRNTLFSLVLQEELPEESQEEFLDFLKKSEELSEQEIPTAQAREEFIDNQSAQPATAQQIIDLEMEQGSVLMDSDEEEEPVVYNTGEKVTINGKEYTIGTVGINGLLLEDSNGDIYETSFKGDNKDFSEPVLLSKQKSKENTYSDQGIPITVNEKEYILVTQQGDVLTVRDKQGNYYQVDATTNQFINTPPNVEETEKPFIKQESSEVPKKKKEDTLKIEPVLDTLDKHEYTKEAVYAVDMIEGDLLHNEKGTFVVKRGQDNLFAFYPPIKNGKFTRGKGVARELPHVGYRIKKEKVENKIKQSDVQQFLGSVKGYTSFFNQLQKEGKIEIQC